MRTITPIDAYRRADKGSKLQQERRRTRSAVRRKRGGTFIIWAAMAGIISGGTAIYLVRITDLDATTVYPAAIGAALGLVTLVAAIWQGWPAWEERAHTAALRTANATVWTQELHERVYQSRLADLEHRLQNGPLIQVTAKKVKQSPSQPAPRLKLGRKSVTSQSLLDIWSGGRGPLLLVGPAGSGKTTVTLLMLVDLLQQNRGILSDWFPVAEWYAATGGGTRGSLEAWMADRLEADYAIPRNTAIDIVKRDSFWPIFDGLDELPSARVRLEFTTALRKYQGSIPRGRNYILTSRTSPRIVHSTYRTAGLIAIVEPLSQRQVSLAIEDALPYVHPDWRQLAADISANLSDTARLLSTPLRLSTCLSVYQERSPLELAGLDDERAQGHLWNLYLEDAKGSYRRRSVSQLRDWIVWLAYNMEQDNRRLIVPHELARSFRRERWVHATVQVAVVTLAGLIIAVLSATACAILFGGGWPVWVTAAVASILSLMLVRVRPSFMYYRRDTLRYRRQALGAAVLVGAGKSYLYARAITGLAVFAGASVGLERGFFGFWLWSIGAFLTGFLTMAALHGIVEGLGAWLRATDELQVDSVETDRLALRAVATGSSTLKSFNGGVFEGLVGGCIAATVATLTLINDEPLRDSIAVGACVGLIVALLLALATGAGGPIYYKLGTWIRWLSGRSPLDLDDFLGWLAGEPPRRRRSQVLHRPVMRRSGDAFEFIHPSLQDYLAASSAPTPSHRA